MFVLLFAVVCFYTKFLLVDSVSLLWKRERKDCRSQRGVGHQENKVAQQVRYMPPRLVTWVWSLGSTPWNKRTDSCKSSYDHNMCVMACMFLKRKKSFTLILITLKYPLLFIVIFWYQHFKCFATGKCNAVFCCRFILCPFLLFYIFKFFILLLFP